jgi:hypothetical protein
MRNSILRYFVIPLLFFALLLSGSVGAQSFAPSRVAAKIAARQSWNRLKMTANVEQVIKDLVIFKRGTKSGICVGDTFAVVRGVNGRQMRVGLVRVFKAFSADSEAEIISGADFRKGDKAIRLAPFAPTGCPPVVIKR